MNCSNTKTGTQVYIAEIDDRIKIGASQDPATRLQAIKGEHKKILALLHGGYEAEKALHLRFRPYWIEGEYFSRGPVLLDFAAQQSAERPCFSCIHGLGHTTISDAKDEATRLAILDAIKVRGDNNTHVSKLLGMSTRHLIRTRKRLGIPRKAS